MVQSPDTVCFSPKDDMRVAARKIFNKKEDSAYAAYNKVEDAVKAEVFDIPGLNISERERLIEEKLLCHKHERDLLCERAIAERDAKFREIEIVGQEVFAELEEMAVPMKKAFEAYLKSKRHFEKRRDKLLEKKYAEIGLKYTPF